MISADDWVDVLCDCGCAKKQAAPKSAVRRFFSEYEIKKMIGRGNILKVPANAILSPLAQEWLTLSGVRVEREA